MANYTLLNVVGKPREV